MQSNLFFNTLQEAIPYYIYIYSFIYHMSIASWSITFDLKGMACFLVNLHL